MKKIILVAGVFFYAVTFACIFWMTFLFNDISKPEGARVLNVNTREEVWQPDMATFDMYAETGFEARVNPAHNSDTFSVGESVGGNIELAYGAYYKALFTDDGETKPPQPSGGDQAYTEAVCFHCHSQFVRPLRYENDRWGPTSQIGESAHENPTRFGTRRIGPDLTREGGLRPDDWHYAHFNHPRYTSPQSIMAPFGYGRYWYDLNAARKRDLQKRVYEALNEQGASIKGLENAAAGFNFAKGLIEEFEKEGDQVWVLWKGRKGGIDAGNAPVLRVAQKPRERIRDLTAYVQTRGIGIGITGKTDKLADDAKADDQEWQRYMRKLEFSPGIWRTPRPVGRPQGRPDYVMAPAELAAKRFSENENMFHATQETWDLSVKAGANLFMLKCAGCHGGLDESGNPLPFDLADKRTLRRVGNGYGPAAEWLIPEPRNFHLSAWPEQEILSAKEIEEGKEPRTLMPAERGSDVGSYKNHSGGDTNTTLARPEDIFATIRNGMAPSSMPSWPFLTDWEIWGLVNFIMFLGDDEANIQERLAKGGREEIVRTKQSKSYYNLDEVRKAFDREVTAPNLATKPSLDAAGVKQLLASAPNASSLSGKAKEDYAAAFWADKLGSVIILDGSPWTNEELAAIGAVLFAQKDADGNTIQIANGANAPECATCHGRDGDSWGSRRGEMISAAGISARNYYSGQFKLGPTRDGIYRAMYLGMNNTPMNTQINDTWTALEAVALAEFVLDKARQGTHGIRD